MKSFIQMNEINGPVHLKAAELPSLEAAPPAKRGRRRWLYLNFVTYFDFFDAY